MVYQPKDYQKSLFSRSQATALKIRVILTSGESSVKSKVAIISLSIIVSLRGVYFAVLSGFVTLWQTVPSLGDGNGLIPSNQCSV